MLLHVLVGGGQHRHAVAVAQEAGHVQWLAPLEVLQVFVRTLLRQQESNDLVGVHLGGGGVRGAGWIGEIDGY